MLKIIDVIVATVLIIGGFNWGLVGLFQFDLLAELSGGKGSFLSRIIYTIIGICAVYQV